MRLALLLLPFSGGTTMGCRSCNLRHVARQRKRRLWAATLCAASFATGQALFGQTTPPGANSPAPSLLSQYSQAKSQMVGLPSGDLRPPQVEPAQIQPLKAPARVDVETVRKAVAGPHATASDSQATFGARLTNSGPHLRDLQPAEIKPAAQLTNPAMSLAQAESAKLAGQGGFAATTPSPPAYQAEQPHAKPGDEKLPPIVPSWAMPRPGTKKLKLPAGSQPAAVATREPDGGAKASDSVVNSKWKTENPSAPSLSGLPQPLRLELGAPPTPSPATIVVPPKTIGPATAAERPAAPRVPFSALPITAEKTPPAPKPAEAAQRAGQTRAVSPGVAGLPTIQSKPERSIAQAGPLAPTGQQPPPTVPGEAKPTRLPPIAPPASESPFLMASQKSPAPAAAETRNPHIPSAAPEAPKPIAPLALPMVAPIVTAKAIRKPPSDAAKESKPPAAVEVARSARFEADLPQPKTGSAIDPPHPISPMVEKIATEIAVQDVASAKPLAATKAQPEPRTSEPVSGPRDAAVAVQAAATAAPESPKQKLDSQRSPVQRADYEIRAFAIQPPQPAPLRGAAEEELNVLPAGSPFEAVQQSGVVKLRVRRSILLRTKVDIYRTAIVDETVCDIVQFTPREVSIIGRAVGQTHVTFWLDEPGTAPLTYLVEVQPDPQQIKADESKYELLQNVINEMFPDSKVHLVLVADKLLVKGQAKDSEEAAQIMTIIRAQAAGSMGGGMGGAGSLGGLAGFGLAQGLATPVLPAAATGGNTGPSYQVINMLRVPGIQQVALKVKIAELNRSRARGFGLDVRAAINFSDSTKATQLFLASLLNTSNVNSTTTTGSGTSVVTSFGGQDVNIGLRYLQEAGVIRLLSEPTLVTLSGRPATFIAGGEFAVPTIVGSVGLNAVTTDFRAFGAIISFLPTIVDKDRIRLQVAPEFSQLNNALRSANNTPGLNVRAATTTVEMREGQTLAIAGLLEDTYKATNVGDIPGLAKIFGRRDTARSETELIILVTPELVHPMEPEEVPPLPGFDVTEPTGAQFFLHGDIEGNPTQDYRSTVWPRLRRRYGMGGPAMTSGPFGHGQ